MQQKEIKLAKSDGPMREFLVTFSLAISSVLAEVLETDNNQTMDQDQDQDQTQVPAQVPVPAQALDQEDTVNL